MVSAEIYPWGQMMAEPNDKVTPHWMYVNRRRFMRSGAMAASIAATAGIYRWLNPNATATTTTPPIKALNAQTQATPNKATPNKARPNNGLAGVDTPSGAADNQAADQVAANSAAAVEANDGLRADDALTAERFIVNYNNFYEFTTSKTQVGALAAGFRTEGWQLEVDGLVDKPGKFSIADLHALSRPQERIYRMRCVEGWSMVIPWVGIELSHLLEAVQPQSAARYVAFETLYDPNRMPGQKVPVLKWPYVEGLRLDEAMHRLTILATGLYGKELPAQDGAPVRLVVPWKYGFKGIKSIVRISLVATEPETSWNMAAPNEYGFYANVNPHVDHPRWSQATEQRIGEFKRRPTLMFNGYEEQVAGLYDGMDLKQFF